MGVLLPAILGAGTGLLGSLISAHGTSKTNSANLQAVRETNAAQMELAKYQYEQNLAQWNRENAYNDPSSQMQRLANAGLNPHLVYNNGNAITPAANSPEYSAPNLQAYHQDVSPFNAIGQGVSDAASSAFSNYLAFEKQKASLENLGYQNKKLVSDIALNEASSALRVVERAYKKGLIKSQKAYNDRVGEILDANLENTRAATKKMNSEIYNLEKQSVLYEAEARYQDSMVSLNKEQMEVQKQLVRKYQSEIANIVQLTAESKSRQALIEAQRVGQLINNDWNKRFGSNAPWWAKMVSNVIDDPMGVVSGAKVLLDKAGEIGAKVVNTVTVGFKSVMFGALGLPGAATYHFGKKFFNRDPSKPGVKTPMIQLR